MGPWLCNPNILLLNFVIPIFLNLCEIDLGATEIVNHRHLCQITLKSLIKRQMHSSDHWNSGVPAVVKVILQNILYSVGQKIILAPTDL